MGVSRCGGGALKRWDTVKSTADPIQITPLSLKLDFFIFLTKSRFFYFSDCIKKLMTLLFVIFFLLLSDLYE